MKIIERSDDIVAQIYPHVAPDVDDTFANASADRITIENDGTVLFNGEVVNPLEAIHKLTITIEALYIAMSYKVNVTLSEEDKLNFLKQLVEQANETEEANGSHTQNF